MRIQLNKMRHLYFLFSARGALRAALTTRRKAKPSVNLLLDGRVRRQFAQQLRTPCCISAGGNLKTKETE
jgi:hypothetical protein